MHFVGLDEAIADLRAGVEAELPHTMLTVCSIVADEAARQHPYQNRTMNLQRHTVPGRVTGGVSSGRLRGEVLGDMFYGSFVDEGTSRNRAYPFLLPAFRRADYALDATLDRGLQVGALRGGWAP